MEEIWKDIFENQKYYISSLGRIKNNKNYIIKTHDDKDGYQIYSFYVNGKRITKRINRLVAEAFIPNPKNLPIANHKNEIKNDNRVDNLEWCNEQYNTNYGNAREKQKKNFCKSVICIELNKEFKSATEAAKFIKRDKSSICDCCNEKRQRKTTGGYHWKWKES